MSPGATFERVYRSIKIALGSGAFVAGQALEPSALAAELNSSITPVRDALHRLVGEGLVEAPQADGFRTPSATEFGLRHLYRWNASLLGLSARVPAHTPLRGRPFVAAEGLEPTETLFAAIGARSGNPEQLDAILRLNERLRPARRTEARIIEGLAAELVEIRTALEENSAPAIRRSVAAYHARRERLVPEIVTMLHSRD